MFTVLDLVDKRDELLFFLAGQFLSHLRSLPDCLLLDFLNGKVSISVCTSGDEDCPVKDDE